MAVGSIDGSPPKSSVHPNWERVTLLVNVNNHLGDLPTRVQRQSVAMHLVQPTSIHYARSVARRTGNASFVGENGRRMKSRRIRSHRVHLLRIPNLSGDPDLDVKLLPEITQHNPSWV